MSNMKKRKKFLLGATAVLMSMSMGLAACQPEVTPPGPDPDPNPGPTTNYLQEGTYNPYKAYEEQLKLKGKFNTDYATMHQAFVAGRDLNIQIAEEGFVLLKNENNALPLNNFEARATAFGYRSVNLQQGGGGSGSTQTSYIQNEGFSIATLQSSLESVGMQLNPTMASFYTSNSRSESNPSAFPSTVINSYKNYNDVALVVFARGGSEGSDLSAADNAEGKHSLQLSNAEEALIRHAKQYFKKVVVLINAANCMEVGELNAPKTAGNLGVDAILQVGHVGVDGAAAIGPILTGKVNPSGHTVDTWERDFRKGPSFANFGAMTQNGIDETSGEAYNNHYYIDGEDANRTAGRQSVEYREDIYMGYRYYETVHADLNSASAGSGDTWYDNAVVYSFGYGLSYTTFEWELDESIAPTAEITAANSTVTMKVKVTNTGKVAGKDVVQIYATPPYYDGGIEKAEVNLVGFAKTQLLKPGESETVTVQFVAQDMASFDWDDRNLNGFVGYELEAGDYIISARSDAHTVKAQVTRTVAEDIKCETDLVTGATINAVFSQIEGNLAYYNTMNDALINNLLSREGGLNGTAPVASTSADRTITQADLDQWNYYADAPAYADDASDPWYVSAVPDSWTQTSESERASGTGKTAIQLYDMAGISYTEPVLNADGTITLGTDEGSKKWDEFMNQLTWEEMEAFALAGGWGRRAIPAIGNPEAADQDGPNQIGNQAGRNNNGPAGTISNGGDLNNGNALGSGVAFISEVIVASTWNVELAEEEGRIMGNFSLFLNCPGWYGPGLNTHRSPFGGRNFEYYSEDGVLGGKMGAAVIRGATKKGVICYPKHLALNEQETNRSSVNTWATEQAIREIYLKPYELAVKEGGTMGFMTAMGNMGAWACYSNGALQNELMRKEWGFKGVFETDANGSGGAFKTLGIMFRNGTDINLARTRMITSTLGEDAEIINAEATYWDATARGGKGMVKVAPDAAIRAAANRTVHNGWTEGIGGTTEFKFYNWRDKSQVSSQLTLDSPTYYYWLRLAVMHTLYCTANSNSLNNGMPSWMWHGDVVDEIAINANISTSGEGDESVRTLTFNKSVTADLETKLEEGVKVTSVYLAGVKDLPAYTTNVISAAVLEQLISDGVTERLSNAEVENWLAVSNDGTLSADLDALEAQLRAALGEGHEEDAVDIRGTYTAIVAVQLDYFHVINIKVTLTIN